ncbi:MAG: response regulator [Spirochaetaceae bacterium]|jgi:putative two-component system response regulator|nr:response regulator [Spirochaetaceae bacterium]
MKNILFADDNRSIRSVMEKNLVGLGLDPLVLKDGSEVESLIETGQYPPLIILDWEMPGKTGPELCRLIKKNQKDNHRSSYVILCTTRDSREDKIIGLSQGADDYLTKPFDIAELEARIKVGQRILDYQKELLEKEYQIRVSCYSALTELAETHCLETGEHLYRVGKLASLMAQWAKLSDDFIRDIEIFSPMHDIGKVGIPESILYLPRELTTEEFQLMKNHTIQGWKILKDKPSLEMAAEIALTHHEHWDGKGYPQNLDGKNIPISGRITAICDVFDTLRSKRSYKINWNHEDSLEFILSQKEKAFDPKLVNLLEKNQRVWEDLYKKYKEDKIDPKEVL